MNYFEPFVNSTDSPDEIYGEVRVGGGGGLPAWSLAALLNVMSDELEENHYLTIRREENEYCCCYEDINGNSFTHTFSDNPIDACVEMIIKLKEKGLI